MFTEYWDNQADRIRLELEESCSIFSHSLKNRSVFSIKEIKSWLNENWEKYRDLKDVWECEKCPTNLGLPCICREPDEEWKFFKLYEALDELSNKHRKEKYFEQEMLEYNEIQFSEIDLKIWTAKNEKFGVDDFCCFEFDYLDYECENDSTKHLRVANSELKLMVTNVLRKKLSIEQSKLKSDFEVFVDRNDFKFTLEFIDTFRELFWNREILPESIERIDKEMEKTK